MPKKSNGFVSKRINRSLDEMIAKAKTTFRFVMHSVSGFVAGMYEVRDKSKDLVQTNILVAEGHLKNNNIFDANLRYNIVLKLDKYNFEALYGLGYIAFLRRKYQKSWQYLQMAFKSATNNDQKQQVGRILKKVREKTNN